MGLILAKMLKTSCNKYVYSVLNLFLFALKIPRHFIDMHSRSNKMFLTKSYSEVFVMLHEGIITHSNFPVYVVNTKPLHIPGLRSSQ
jgi:hypothetical protein